MKGVILAGGRGTRLAPITAAVNKHLLPVYDKPLIYYPLATLMLADIKDILVITRPEDRQSYETLLQDGSQYGIKLSYQVQERPVGIADAVLVAAEFLGESRFALILGDNVFFGHGLREILLSATEQEVGATIFAYWVHNPSEFGVVELGDDGRVLSLVEKPAAPRSNFVVPGLYFYDGQALGMVDSLAPSSRGELEITDLNSEYLRRGQLHVRRLERGFAWLDTGSPQALLDAGNYIATIEHRQGLKIACPEEIAWHSGWITEQQLKQAAARHATSEYGSYLLRILEHGL